MIDLLSKNLAMVLFFYCFTRLTFIILLACVKITYDGMAHLAAEPQNNSKDLHECGAFVTELSN